MTRPILRRTVGAWVGLATARAVFEAAIRSPSADRWQRTNHRGEVVTLLAGPAVAVGALAGCAMTPGLPGRLRGAAGLAGVAAATLGAYDDLAGSGAAKGLRGHLGALRRGELTTGGAKLLGIGVAGVVAGAWARPGRAGVVDALLAGAVVAGAANLLNLLDLRPGRAIKAALLVAAPATVTPWPAGDLVAGPLGAAVGLLPADLAERAMLGDAGANALGAMLGVAAASSLSRGWLSVTAAGVVAVTLASERVSFTAVIERTPPLRALDRLGRRVEA